MRWVSVSEVGANLGPMVSSAMSRIEAAFSGKSPDLLFVFVTPHFASNYVHLPDLLRQSFPSARIAGCSAYGVIGGGHETEDRPAISILAGVLPSVSIQLFWSDTLKMPDEDASPEAWRQWLGLHEDQPVHFVILADPMTAHVEPFINGLDFAFPESVKVGGLCSGGNQPGKNVLFVNDHIHEQGLVCLALSGDVRIDPVVAQGCRPIGAAMVITNCRKNLLLACDHKPPLRYLNEIYQEVSETDQQLMRNSLFIGVGVDTPSDPDSPVFLIRNLIGADHEAGSVTVGAHLQEGQIIQFFLRDRQTSREDLDLVLEQYTQRNGRPEQAGALLFSCVGRGQHLFGRPDHDSGRFAAHIGDCALGGFFCNGEIGPVGGATFIHGYTSAFGIIRPRSG